MDDQCNYSLEDSEGDSGWATSYGDVVTLLLVFFVIISTMTSKTRSEGQKSGRQAEDKDYTRYIVFLEKNIKKTGLEKYVQIKKTEGGLEIIFNDKILFDSGSYVLKSQPLKGLSTLTASLNKLPKTFKFAIEGHTDNRPIISKSIPTNWHLSALRSINIVQLLIQNGIKPERIWSEAYGPYRPVKKNTSKEKNKNSQALNRRVVIRIIAANAH